MGTEIRCLIHSVIPGANGFVLAEDVPAVFQEFNGVNSIKSVMVDNSSAKWL